MKNEAAGSSKFASDLAPAAISSLQVVIPHRTAQLTRAALKYAASLSNDLNARIRLVDVYVVPYGVPLDEPPVNPKHLARKIGNWRRRAPCLFLPRLYMRGTGSKGSGVLWLRARLC